MAAVTREGAHAALDKLTSGLVEAHQDADAARLDQLDRHTQTVHMVIDQLYDDAEKR